MARRLALIFALGLVATSAVAQETAMPSQDAAVAPPPELKALADTCAAHKFEANVTVEGRARPTKVKICGKQGQTNADWLNPRFHSRDRCSGTGTSNEFSDPWTNGAM